MARTMVGLNQEGCAAAGAVEIVPGGLLLDQELKGAASAFQADLIHSLLDGPHIGGGFQD